MIDVKGLAARLSRLQRFVLVAGILWFLFLVPRGISEIARDYKGRLQLSEQVDRPACAELVAASSSEFERDPSQRVSFRGRAYDFHEECYRVASTKLMLAPAKDNDERFKELVAASRAAYEDAARQSLTLVMKLVAPLLMLYGIGVVVGWVLRGKRASPG